MFKSAKLILAWRPAVHLVYYAEVNQLDDNITDVTISLEAQYEFFICERRTRKDIDPDFPRCTVCTLIERQPERSRFVNPIQHYMQNIKFTDQKLQGTGQNKTRNFEIFVESIY